MAQTVLTQTVTFTFQTILLAKGVKWTSQKAKRITWTAQTVPSD